MTLVEQIDEKLAAINLAVASQIGARMAHAHLEDLKELLFVHVDEIRDALLAHTSAQPTGD